MQITIKTLPDVSRSIHERGPPTTESEELLRVVETFGVVLKPMHSDMEDPNLMSYFIVDVPDTTTTQHVITRLRQLGAIEAAYVKPPDELP